MTPFVRTECLSIAVLLCLSTAPPPTMTCSSVLLFQMQSGKPVQELYDVIQGRTAGHVYFNNVPALFRWNEKVPSTPIVHINVACG